MTRSLFKSRTLLAAAALATLAAGCHSAGARPPAAPVPTSFDSARADARSAQDERAIFAAAAAPEVIVTPVATPVVAEVVPVASPAPAAPAAEPMCDPDGRPLAGNVRKGGYSKDNCEIAQAGPQL